MTFSPSANDEPGPRQATGARLTASRLGYDPAQSGTSGSRLSGELM